MSIVEIASNLCLRVLNSCKTVPRSLFNTSNAIEHYWKQLFAQFLPRHSGTLDSVGDLLESNVSCEVWTAMLRLDID